MANCTGIASSATKVSTTKTLPNGAAKLPQTRGQCKRRPETQSLQAAATGICSHRAHRAKLAARRTSLWRVYASSPCATAWRTPLRDSDPPGTYSSGGPRNIYFYKSLWKIFGSPRSIDPRSNLDRTSIRPEFGTMTLTRTVLFVDFVFKNLYGNLRGIYDCISLINKRIYS